MFKPTFCITCDTSQDRVSSWDNYFKELWGESNTDQDTENDIPKSVFVYMDLSCAQFILIEQRTVFCDGKILVESSVSETNPLPKSRNLTILTNYCGISLNWVPAKNYYRLIVNRLRPSIQPHLKKYHNSFRFSRSTWTQIMTLRRDVEEVKDKNLQVVITFIDFCKAFHSINRQKGVNLTSLWRS